MRQFLFSKITIIIFSAMLTACGGSTTGENAVPKASSSSPSEPASIRSYIINDDIVDLETDSMASNFINEQTEALPEFAIPTDKNGDAYTSIAAVIDDPTLLDDGDVVSFTLPVLGVHRYYQHQHTRKDASVAWEDGDITNIGTLVDNTNSIISIYYHKKDGTVYYQGDDDKIGAEFYRTIFDKDGNEVTNKYVAKTGTSTRDTHFKGAIDGIDSADLGANVQFHGDAGATQFFGFAPKHLAVVTFYVTEDQSLLNDEAATVANTDYHWGRMVAGLETGREFGGTAFGAIPDSTTASVTFVGRGYGFYGGRIYDNSSRNLSQRKAHRFDMAANVNFASYNIDFSTYNTCYTRDCEIKNEELDFNATISFGDGAGNAHNNMKTDIATNNGRLTGTLDARFYGDAAQEFGGTFAMTGTGGDNTYYYGVFAGNQTFGDKTDGESFSAEDVADVYNYYATPKKPSHSYNSFTQALTANRNSQFVTLGTAVQKSDITHYVRDGKTVGWDATTGIFKQRDIELANYGLSTVSLNVSNNKIADVEVYFGFRIYTATLDENATGTLASNTYHDAKTGNITASRDEFGFDSNYMVYLDWDFEKTSDELTNAGIADDIYNIDGMMVTGIEASTLPTSIIASFAGAGKGIYGDNTASHAVTFNTAAEVDFGARNVTVKNSNTACNVTSCPNASTLATLDFDATLSYEAGETNMQGDATAGAGGALSGKIDARAYGAETFYGTGEEAPAEFGGTFALADGTNYYYGAFGAQRTSIAIDAIDAPFTANQKDTGFGESASTYSQYDSFLEARTQSVQVGAHLVRTPALVAFRNETADYTRANTDAVWQTNNQAGSVIIGNHKNSASAIRYAGLNLGHVELVQIYLSELSYRAFAPGGDDIVNNPTSTDHHDAVATNVRYSHPQHAYVKFGDTNFDADTDDANDADIDSNITIIKPTEFGGFRAKYMAYLSWNFVKEADDLDATKTADSRFDKAGYMVSGFETEHNTTGTDGDSSNDLPVTGTATFIGGGMGNYHSGKAAYDTSFETEANVDFAMGEIGFFLQNTTATCTAGAGQCDDITALNLDISTGLTYQVGVNNIASSNVTVDGMKGQIDARFYGQNRSGGTAEANAAKEFGGAFSFRGAGVDSDKSYIGIFGACDTADTVACPQ